MIAFQSTSSRRSAARARQLLALAVFCSGFISAAAAVSEKALEGMIDDFFKPEDIHGLSLSPDGATIAFQKHSSRGDALMTVDAKTLKQLGFVGGDAGESIRINDWADSAHLVYQIVKFDKYLSDAVVANRTLSSRKALMPDGWPDLIDVTPYVDGEVLIRSMRTDALHSEVLRLDFTQPGDVLTSAAKNPGGVVAWKADLAGQVRIGYKTASEGETTAIHRWSENDAWEEMPLPRDAYVVGFRPKSDSVLITYPKDAGRQVLQGYNLRTRELLGEPIADPVCDIAPAILRNNETGDIAGFMYDSAKPRTIWIDREYAQVHEEARKLMPGLIHWFHGVTATNEMMISSWSDVQPTNYWLFNRETKTARYFKRSRPWIDSAQMCEVQPVTFRSRDGASVHGYFTKPKTGTAPHPLIMLVHGGPAARDNWGFDPEVQFLAKLGYAVMQVNYRGSSGYGRDYQLPTYLDVVKSSVDDVADGARWAIGSGMADGKRVAVYGGSFGGYVALASAVRYPELYRCVLGFAGVYDYEEQLKGSKEERGAMLKWQDKYYGDIRTAPEKFREYSPVFSAEKVMCPVWLMHGGADGVVAVNQTKRMAAALKKAGKTVEVRTDTWGVHGLWDPQRRQTYYRSLATFLGKYLPVE
jgi:dipeptidyl aminopeptidase/acylaminoacyl peptidase